MNGISNIQKVFINDIKKSKLMVDEFTVSNDEVVSMCFRYVDSKKDMQEVFSEFFDFERISGTVIGKEMLNVLEQKETAVKHSIRQRCDGVPNIQPGKKCGVIYIRKRTSSSFYTLRFAQLKFSVSGSYENSNH